MLALPPLPPFPWRCRPWPERGSRRPRSLSPPLRRAAQPLPGRFRCVSDRWPAGDCWLGFADTAATCPGGATPSRIGCGSARSCSSRPRWSGSATTSADSWSGFPAWSGWPKPARPTCSPPGRAWATTAGPGSCMPVRSGWWPSMPGGFRAPSPSSPPCRASAATPPLRSVRSPLAGPSRSWRPTRGECLLGLPATTGR